MSRSDEERRLKELARRTEQAKRRARELIGIPRDARSSRVASGAHREEGPPQAPTAPLVLVVDDEPAMRLIMARQLSSSGFRVLTAASGEEALALLPAVAVSVVVTDTWMPGGISGVELIRRVRGTWPEVAILRISGVSDSRLSDDEPPANVPFLAKPFSADRLVAEVHALAASRRS